MSTSQNGFAANDRSVIVSVAVPGGKLTARRGPVADLAGWLARRYHDTVEPLTWPGCWGYAERNIRGSSSTLSNHASGTAWDFCAPAHPLGKVGTMGRALPGANVLADLVAPVARWGGRYAGRKDEMHWEVIAREQDVAAFLARVTATPAPAAQPTPSGRRLPAFPLPVGNWFGPASSDARNHSGTAASATADRASIQLLLDALRARRWRDVPPVNVYTPAVADLVRRYQVDAGLPADGLAGRGVWESVATSGVR